MIPIFPDCKLISETLMERQQQRTVIRRSPRMTRRQSEWHLV